MDERYEINHKGEIVKGEASLCADQSKMLHELFSQNGWTCTEEEKEGSCRKLTLTDPNGNSKTINVYSGTIRNEKRNAYEKKIQLGAASDPRKKSKDSTIIIGIYVFEANDTAKDAIFVGYPIDETVNYDANPSIRGTFVNRLLIQAKTEGFVYDSEHNTVGFRSEFAYYYLSNYYHIHYENELISKLNDDSVYYDENDSIDGADNQQIDLKFETGIKSKFPRNRIIFGAPGTGKSFRINKERQDLLGDANETDYERVTFHPDYSYANFVGTYKPVMVDGFSSIGLDADTKEVIVVLNDNSLTAQEKYYLLYKKFKDDGLTMLPVLLGLYTDEPFKTSKQNGSDAANDNSVEKNHGRAIRKYVNLITGKEKSSDIAYEYVPGPFMRMYVKALKSARTANPKPYLLIIEEINRANVAAVFGDVFQLLDRDDDEVSEYPIQASEDIKKYLAKELGGDPEDYNKIKIPDNMFIWATMNSADQGVFPMDTAFKRRWDFTYLGIDDSDEDIRGKYVVVGSKEQQRIEWNELRKAINNFLANEKINEDKQLGPYFIVRKIVVPADGGTEIDSKKFCDVFKHKVLMYLFDDAAKQKRGKLFVGIAKEQNRYRYSKICEAFDEQGIGIFHPDIHIQRNIKDLKTNEHELDENGVVKAEEEGGLGI